MLFRMKFAAIVVVVIILVLTLSSCSSKNLSVSYFSLRDRETKISVSYRNLHSSDKADLSFVASSGLTQLYFDKTTTSVAVFDTSSEKYWSALPFYENNNAAVINVTLSNSGNVYSLNSQDNSVAFSSFSTQFSDKGVKVTYYMSDSLETVNKSVASLSADDVFVVIPVEFILEDGSLFVNIESSSIFVANNYVIESLSIMPYFGAISYSDEALQAESLEKASENEEETAEEQTTSEQIENSEETAEETQIDLTEDFILVPDGCGAVMYTKIADAATESLSFPVYGCEDGNSENSALVGAFGIKDSDSAFVAVIEEGEALSSVKAFRDTANADSSNIVFCEFSPNPNIYDNSKVYYTDMYDGSFSLCYRFMSSSEANYISMAASCREALIRNGVLSSQSVSSNSVGLNISFVCSVDGSSSKKTSDFEEIEDILSILKAKGLNNVNVILNGMFTGGFAQTKAAKANIPKTLGGNNGLQTLSSYAEKQGYNVFAGVNIITAKTLAFYEQAESLLGEKIVFNVSNPVSSTVGKSTYTLDVLSADEIEKNIIVLMNNTKNLGVSGFCINDAANMLFGDYSESSMNSALVATILSENISSFSTQGKLMLSGANFYALRNADILVDVPFYTHNPVSEGYCAVPFVMAILHSTVEYSGASANTCSVPQLEMLKCIEYGGVPYFTWVYDNTSGLYFENNLTQVVEFALRAENELSDTVNARITSHYQVFDGVYCTSYDNGAIVYVNYNNYSATIGELSVLPYDFLRIN